MIKTVVETLIAAGDRAKADPDGFATFQVAIADNCRRLGLIPVSISVGEAIWLPSES